MFGVVSLLPGVGWIIGGVYFVGNYALQQTTGKSAGDYVEKGLSDPSLGNPEKFDPNRIFGGGY
jgi:hypothetical protein